MFEFLRVIGDRHDGSYEAERLVDGRPGGRFLLFVLDGAPLLHVGSIYTGERVRVTDIDEPTEAGDLVYVLQAAALT